MSARALDCGAGDRVLVDELRPCNAPWRGGIACHLGHESGDRDALHRFAASIGLPRRWYQQSRNGLTAHYDLSPSWRKKAVAAGAHETTAREWARARITEYNRRVQTGGAASGTGEGNDA